jgi:hypothetical protein
MIGIVITEMRSLTTSDTNTGNFETLPCILWNFIDIYNKYIIILNSCLFLSYIEAPFCAYSILGMPYGNGSTFPAVQVRKTAGIFVQNEKPIML